jgi:hypothetical protein
LGGRRGFLEKTRRLMFPVSTLGISRLASDAGVLTTLLGDAETAFS